MAKAKLQAAIAALSGSLGKDQEYTFRRTKKGKTILIKKPDMSKVKWSGDQVSNRHTMREAVAFAQGVLADPERKKAYDKRAKRKRTDAFHLAISEYLKDNSTRARKSEARAASSG